MKEGQVSYFILVAVALLLVMVGLLYMFASSSTIEVVTQGSPIPAMPAIQNFFQTCVELVGTKGVYHLGYKGGYISAKGDKEYGEPGDGERLHRYQPDTVLPYAANGEDIKLRPISEMNTMLSRYVLVNLDECLDFSNFEKQGLVVQKPKIDFAITGFDPSQTRVDYAPDPVLARANIGAERVDIEVQYPVLVKSRQGQALLTNTVASLPFRLGTLHAITGSLLAESAVTTPYDLVQHCKKFGTKDGMVNIYLDSHNYYQDHALSVVDAKPLEEGFTPLRFQVGVLNQNMTGVCKG